MKRMVLVVMLYVALAGTPAFAGSHVRPLDAGLGRTAQAPVEPSFWTWDFWQKAGNKVVSSRSEIVRNLGLLLLGLIGLGFGIWRAYTAHRQVRISEQGQFTERFSAAVGLLGDEKSTVRMGGVYALGRFSLPV